MTDIAPMEPCPADKRGRHELSAIIPDDDTRDLTLFCSHCGALRRRPVTGPLSPVLDDLDADEIAAAFRG